MTRRVFANVKRGITDKTAVCVYPWEILLLQHIHGGEVEVVTIDRMCAKQEGEVKTEKVKIKHSNVHAPLLREQLEAMEYVSPDDDPANDPAAEYARLAEKYGMDKEVPMLVVTRIYGELAAGGFEKVVLQHAKDRATKPRSVELAERGLGKDPAAMSLAELRDTLTELEIEWFPSEKKAALVDKLDQATAPG